MTDKLEKKPGSPYYMQLMNILRARIQSGELKEGRIPTVRQLAREYQVSANTALRAYEGLRQEGLIAGAVGRGTFITGCPKRCRGTTGRNFSRG